ncbi:MAG: DNA primase [Desulfarculaceae bacterium]
MASTFHIPQDKIDEIRLAADIVQIVGSRVRLVKKGKDFWGLCPFHSDSDPSFKVDREKGTWYCFGCSEGGSVFNFIMKDEGLSFPEAVREVASRCGIALPPPKLNPAQRRALQERERLLEVLERAASYYQAQLGSADAKEARRYLHQQRGLTQQNIKDFSLGWAQESWESLRRHLISQGVDEGLAIKAGLLAPRDRGGAYDRFRGRVIFPIRDLGGRVISFGGRILGPGEPKYLNGPESPVFKKSASLYNLDRARALMRRNDRALVVEGYFDVITMAAQGFAETVAPLGTALTASQARRLKGQASDIVLVFDGDQAGLKAAERSLPVFLGEGISPRVLLLPSGEDPDSYLRQEGPKSLEQDLDRARPLTEMVLDRIVASGDLSTPEGRSAVVGRAAQVIKSIRDLIARTGYVQRLALALNLPQEVLAVQMGLPRPGRSRTPQAAAAETSPAWDNERCLLELALASPQAAKVLSDDDTLATLHDPHMRQVGKALKEVVLRGAEPTAAAVSQALEDQDLASLVSRLAQDGPRLDPAQAVSRAQAHLDVFRRQRLRQKRRAMKEAIAAAQAAGDDQAVTQLQAQRQQIMSHLSPQDAKKD